MTGPAEVVGGRLLLTASGARIVAAALRLAARAAVRDGIDYRGRPAADEFTVLLAMAEAQAAGSAAGNESRAWRVVVPSSDRTLTTGQAAAILGIGPRAVVARIARGELPARKVGGQWLISEHDARRVAPDGRRDAGRDVPGRPAGRRDRPGRADEADPAQAAGIVNAAARAGRIHPRSRDAWLVRRRPARTASAASRGSDRSGPRRRQRTH